MTLLGRDAGEIDALVTDRYLDSLLGGLQAAPEAPEALDRAVRAVSRRLAGDLPRFHPSFRFEERLALRLAEAAASMRLPVAAGGEADVARIPIARPDGFDPLAVLPDDEGEPFNQTLLIRSAVAASALSLAGAAWFAWRRRAGTTPMGRAARAAHAMRAAAGRPGHA
jgi:hypothetical protein